MTAPSVKQQLAAIRMLCDWPVTGQVMPSKFADDVLASIERLCTYNAPAEVG